MKAKLMIGVVAAVATSLCAQTAWADTHYVDPGGTDAGDCTSSACLTIQYAIGQASSGDTVDVAPGTYNEDLDIAASKTGLELAGGGPNTTIKGVQEQDWPTHTPAISILASGVKVHGFTIESPDYSRTSGNPHSSGITVGAGDVEIYDNILSATDDGSGNSAGWCTLIETYGAWAGDVSGLNIHNNSFTSDTGTDKGSEGVYINYNGDHDPPTGTVTIADNTFGGQIFRAIATERSKTTISGNEISSAYGPNPNFSAAFRGIDVSSPGGNRNPNQDTVAISANVVNGFYLGLKLGGIDNNLSNVSVTQNMVTSNTHGVGVFSSAGGIHCNFNCIQGNTFSGVVNEAGVSLDAENNWWGDASGPTHATNNPSGTGDAVSDDVDFTPWTVVVRPGCAEACCASLCGNGEVDGGEDCDDANDTPYDGCSSTCVNQPPSIPTVSEWGLIALTLVGLVIGSIMFARSRRVADAG